MPPVLRPFQKQLETDCYGAWDAGAHNIMPVSATGSGKTVLFSKLLFDEPGASIAIAHRQELVSQISVALARNGVRHRLVGAKYGSPLMRVITALHVAELGNSYLDPTARCGVGGVDTIVRMHDPWFNQVRKGVIDEGHHVLAENKWGKSTRLFPNARWAFPTATPGRADGKGLGRHADGLTDALVLAPGMRDIINMGYLTDYRVFCPPTRDLDLSQVTISPTTGDMNKDQVRKAVHGSKTIVGNVVKHYLRIARGKLGATFAVDVEEASKIATEYRAAGVPAEVVSWNTPDGMRTNILRAFARRELLQLVNVDMFGEGYDLPALEVVSMVRPTESFPLYSQQWGRVLRLLLEERFKAPGVWDSFSDDQRRAIIASSSKPHGFIIDHVGNYVRHNGPPDQLVNWTLDRREARRGKKSDAIPIRVCVSCLQPFEAVKKRCPWCDHYEPPTARSAPEFVDGDLTELDPQVLAAMRGEIVRMDGDFKPHPHTPPWLDHIHRGKWTERQQGQQLLRSKIALWAGWQAHRGESESASYRLFFFRFGKDVANAQLLGTREAEELAANIQTELDKNGVYPA